MNTLEARSRLPRGLLRLSVRNPWLTLAAWMAIGALAALGVLRIEIETSTDSILDRSSREWAFYQESQALFGGDEILTLLIQAPYPYAAETLAEISRLTDVFQELRGVWRVDSLATVPLVRTDAAGGVILEPALARSIPSSSKELEALSEWLAVDRIAPGILVSSDGRYFGLNIVLEQGAEHYYEQVLEKIEQELARSKAWVSGVPIFRMHADSRTRSELAVFVPVTVIAMAILLFSIFRSLSAVVIPLFASGLATWVVIGAMGASHVPITITTVVLPSILLALGCAYSMHVLAAAAGASSEHELIERIEPVALPVALSGLTTSIGFVAVSFVRIEAIRNVGAFGAVGALIVLTATLSAAPAALRLWPLKQRSLPHFRWLQREGPHRLVALAERRGRPMIIAWVLVLGLVAVGIARLDVETDVIVWFPEDDPIRVDYSKIRSELSGISPMNVVIEAPADGNVSSPDAIAAIDGLAHYLESLQEVGRSLAISDPLRSLHGAFNQDPADPLPREPELIDQYLILLEAKQYTQDLISIDHKSANILMRVNDNSSESLLDVARRALEWWRENGVPDYSARATGIMFEFARAEDEIAYGQLRGLAFALGAVAAVLLGVFRSFGLALVALIPNAIPVVMAFGVMGLVGVPLDAGTVVLGNLALGIAVDDTIHIVSGFYEGRQSGYPRREALSHSLHRALPAVVFTTIAVTLGFVVLGVSGFTVTRNLGLLTGGIMVICLLADLLLLPALLLRMGGSARGASRALKNPA